MKRRNQKKHRGSEPETKNSRFHPKKRQKTRDSKPPRGQKSRRELFYKATVDKNKKGFAFLIFDQKSIPDAFVPPREARRLFSGDRIEARFGKSRQLVEIRVLEHRYRELVGRFRFHSKVVQGWVIHERKRSREEVFLPVIDRKKWKNIQTGDWIRVALEFHESGPFSVTGEITQVYGKTFPASADLGIVASEFGLQDGFTQETLEEARHCRLEVPGRDLNGRKDLRSLGFVTVDGETARDFDDAIYVERNPSGHTLWVAIADVSHYVTEGSSLNRDAREKSTSVYFPERAYHMLPGELSEGLCSLRPNEPRLTLVARIEFDASGLRKSVEVFEAVIESKRRWTYTDLEKDRNQHQGDSHWEYWPHFELYERLRQARLNRGSIDFDLPEAQVLVDEQGEVITIENRERLDSHRLIEEFMIAANEAVTAWMMKRDWPFIYRVHDEPSQEALLKFRELAHHLGVSVRDFSSSAKSMSDLIRKLEGHPAQILLNLAFLRSMKQAVYTHAHGEHYGLASEGYTHFTSPIRRYPDLMVHRLIRMALRAGAEKQCPLAPHERKRLEEELAELTEHCSYRERLAAEAERESIRLKQVRAIQKHVGEVFDAKIVGMIAAGLFVQISSPYVEGMVSVDHFQDDFYEFIEEKMIFRGFRTKKVFRIGDPLSVRVLHADLEKRRIDLEPVYSSKSKSQAHLKEKKKR
ncbi:MAG: ribonuclease R [Bdellovibrionia bacterium]